jgi:hypothetical protein
MNCSMTTRFVRRSSSLAVAVGLIITSTSPAGAQAPEPAPAVSLNPIVIAGQLRAAALLERQALARLSEGGAQAEVVPLANRAYVLIRAARAGMIEARVASKFRDPLLDYQISRTTTAWNLARGPVDWSFDSMATDAYVRQSGDHLTKVVELLEEILLVLP